MTRIGIIGSGFGLYGLLPAFNSIKGCEVVSICGKKTERLLKYCESIGLTKIYTHWEEMLENEKLDAVAIAVVPRVQYKIAKTAIKKGFHIFAEKPLAASLKDAEDLFTLAKKKKIVTAVDFIFPEIEEWKKAKELIDKKTYGELKQIKLKWNFLSYDIKNGIQTWKTSVEDGGGALSFYMSHSLNYLEYFGGQIVKTKSIFTYSKESKNGAEVGVDMLLRFKNKISGTVNFRCDAPDENTHKISFVCEKETIVLESNKGVTQNFSLQVFDKKGPKIIIVKKDEIKEGEDERVLIVKKLATRFIDGCKKGKQVSPSFAEGVRVQRLIEQIRKEVF